MDIIKLCATHTPVCGATSYFQMILWGMQLCVTMYKAVIETVILAGCSENLYLAFTNAPPV